MLRKVSLEGQRKAGVVGDARQCGDEAELATEATRSASSKMLEHRRLLRRTVKHCRSTQLPQGLGRKSWADMGLFSGRRMRVSRLFDWGVFPSSKSGGTHPICTFPLQVESKGTSDCMGGLLFLRLKRQLDILLDANPSRYSIIEKPCLSDMVITFFKKRNKAKAGTRVLYSAEQ